MDWNDRQKQIAAMLVIAASLFFLWRQWRGPSIPNPRVVANNAWRTFPKTATIAAEDLKLQINGIDFPANPLVVATGDVLRVRISVLPKPGHYEFLWMLPRLKSQGDAGFDRLDFDSDARVALSQGHQARKSRLIDFTLDIPAIWSPGEYRVRLFRSSKSVERDSLDFNEMLCEGIMQVTPGASAGVTPLSNMSHTTPLFAPSGDEDDE